MSPPRAGSTIGDSENHSLSPTRETNDEKIDYPEQIDFEHGGLEKRKWASGVDGGHSSADEGFRLSAGVPVIVSDQDSRTQRREMRSPPRGRRILNVGPVGGGKEKNYRVKDFTLWNPTSLDDNEEECVTSNGGRSGRGDTIHGMGSATEADRQKGSIARYWATVKARMVDGSPNALGAGAKSQLVELAPVRLKEQFVFCPILSSGHVLGVPAFIYGLIGLTCHWIYRALAQRCLISTQTHASMTYAYYVR